MIRCIVKLGSTDIKKAAEKPAAKKEEAKKETKKSSK